MKEVKKEVEEMEKIKFKMVKFINLTGAHLGFDQTYEPVFAENRTDICAVRKVCQNGRGYGFDIIYIVWKDKNRDFRKKEILNSRRTKDDIFVKSLKIENGKLQVELEIERTLKIPMAILN